ncbi:MAG: glycine cleavage system protein GcvH [Candidatus Omnitrophica bacterium]|nr:glycine cleavage system protein GcvH [Candidatus Omnitrophota bacterium]MCB9720873.1 glycine cleavage system protein GcvH [Candidatus Omnitrophota bacterium]
MEVEDHLLYTKEHEWVNIDGDEATVGISDYAQESLGDITFVELPAAGDDVEQFGELASVESVKAASDIFSPMSGQILEVNEDLNDDPGIINKSPYEKGWIVRLSLSDIEEKNNLMTAEEYERFLESTG